MSSRWGAKFNAGEFTPDGSRFVSAETMAPIEIENLRNGEIEKQLRTHDGLVRSLAFDSSGRYMLTGGGDHRLRVWDLAVTDRRRLKTPVAQSRMSDIAMSPSSGEFAVAYYRTENRIPRIEIREMATHKVVTQLLGHKKMPTCLAYANDGGRLLSGAEDCTVCVWDPATGECLTQLNGHPAPILAVAFLNASQQVISVDRNGGVILWDTEQQTLLETWNIEDEVQSVAFHPHLQIMAIACKGRAVQLCDIHGKKLSELQAASDCRLVHFSPNGRKLATVGVDRRTLVWHTDASVIKGKPPLYLGEIVGQVNQIQDLAFSPDGRRLVSCVRDGSIVLSDVETGHDLLPLSVTSASDGRVLFSSDGKTIVATVGGSIGSWTIGSATSPTSREANRFASLAWHQAESKAAVDSGDWFAAHFHQSQLMRLQPDQAWLFLERARSRMLLGDFAGAEEDLIQSEKGLDPKSMRSMLVGFARVYLAQGKLEEYDRLCERWLQMCSDSSSPTELNDCLWYCSLARTRLDTSGIKQQLEQLMADPKKRKAAYASSLAMHHYQHGEFQAAIDRANQAISLMKEKTAIREWMIIALSCAQMNQHRLRWMPTLVLQKVRQAGLSAFWNASTQYLALVDSRMMDVEKNVKSQKILNSNRLANTEELLIHATEIPFLRNEWEKLAAP